MSQPVVRTEPSGQNLPLAERTGRAVRERSICCFITNHREWRRGAETRGKRCNPVTKAMASVEQAGGPDKTNNAAILYGIEDLVRFAP